MDEVEILPKPNKSENDKKEYRVIKLKNDLVACLIWDPQKVSQDIEREADGETTNEEKIVDEKKAAAMLCIDVGSYSNPKDIQGMAHFLEHMVFMGSEKYPIENDFSAFISKRGGRYNAYTWEERTCFYFDCLEKHLKEALDKFAQFFIAPLLKKDSMQREREAVDTEFQMSVVSDWCRKYQLFSSLALEDSPVNSFGWGNLETLKKNIEDDRLNEELHSFRKRYYSANRMALAVQSRMPMDDLQNVVVECFKDVPNNRLPKDNFSAFGNVYNTEWFNKIYYVKAIDEVTEVRLSWSLPSLYDKYRTKSLNYVAHVIGYEGPGSLLSYLKKQVWATSVCTCYSENSIQSIFFVDIQLTAEGFKHINDVIKATFSYVNLMRSSGPQERIYDDLKVINDTAFKFAAEKPALGTVQGLEKAMHRYSPEHFLTGSKLNFEFDPDEITLIVDYLVPSKVNIMVFSKELSHGLNYDKTEKWFKTEYTVLPLDDLKAQWESVEPCLEFEIPPKNPYLTEDFTLLPEQPDQPEYPKKIIDTNRCELWYRQDQTFKLPLASYSFYLMSPIFIESAKNSALTHLFIDLVNYSLKEEAYPATQAKLSYGLSYYSNKGINISVEGYNEKLPILLDVVIKHIINLSDCITEKIFLGLKEKQIKNEYNMVRSTAYLDFYIKSKILIKHKWSPIEKYNELLNVTYDDMLNFLKDYRRVLYVKALVQGNVAPEVACVNVNKLVESLDYDPLPEEKYPVFTVAKIPIGEKCLYLESFNKEDSKCTTTNYYQVGRFSLRDSVIIDLITQILKDPVFNILRTKEQLGYNVYCSPYETEGVLGYNIGVVSVAHKFTTDYLETRIESFMKHSQNILEDEKDEDFRKVKEDYIKNLECIDLQLRNEVCRNWKEITTGDYIFDRRKQKINLAKEITLEEVRIMWEKHNNFGGQENYRKISVQVAGHVQDKKDEEKKSSEDKLYGKPISLIYLGNNEENIKDDPDYYIKDVDEFRDNLETYPPKLIKNGP